MAVMSFLSAFIRGPETLARWLVERVSLFEKVRILAPQAGHDMVRQGLAVMVKEFPALQGLRVPQSRGGVIDSIPDAIPVISPSGSRFSHRGYPDCCSRTLSLLTSG